MIITYYDLNLDRELVSPNWFAKNNRGFESRLVDGKLVNTYRSSDVIAAMSERKRQVESANYKQPRFRKLMLQRVNAILNAIEV